MPNFIDRRLNPKDKSLSNRQRFLRRARAQIKEVINQSLKDRKITDIDGRQVVSVPTKGIGEPRFVHAPTGGRRERTFTGNKEFSAGDRIRKPQQGEGGGGGPQATDSGEGEDAFAFTLSREEFLDIFFEDLELPDLVKTSLKEIRSFKPRRAGYTSSGMPTAINVLRTMRNSYGRRIALRRPKQSEIDALISRIMDLSAGEPTAAARQEIAILEEELARLERRRKLVPYLDPVDIRYNRFEPQPLPNANAVMFCLMDVSGSMGEREKDLAKRFFVLLHLFLKRRYERIDIVFIRHTHEAQEVDEETFFYSRETGGTVVSTALEEMLRVVRKRYPTREWNIYAAQASDGDNFSGDSEKCMRVLSEEIMPLCQYYAYVEILDEREADIFSGTDNGTALWRSYEEAGRHWPNFQMKRIARPSDIYPVFRELFAKQPKATGAQRAPVGA
ncbi:MAG: YeaH/YhbH family protein [Alphaproteobacteria bacterium]|nr:MAG: YeaH/YhbH family protein [Alphaproteobacteria bacterium]